MCCYFVSSLSWLNPLPQAKELRKDAHKHAKVLILLPYRATQAMSDHPRVSIRTGCKGARPTCQGTGIGSTMKATEKESGQGSRVVR
jgi:hypothetical protein